MGTLVPVTTSPCGLEYSIHSMFLSIFGASLGRYVNLQKLILHAGCPRRHWREVSMIFPGLTADSMYRACNGHCA